MKYKLIENTKIKMKNSQLHQDILKGTKTTKTTEENITQKSFQVPNYQEKVSLKNAQKLPKKVISKFL